MSLGSLRLNEDLEEGAGRSRGRGVEDGGKRTMTPKGAAGETPVPASPEFLPVAKVHACHRKLAEEGLASQDLSTEGQCCLLGPPGMSLCGGCKRHLSPILIGVLITAESHEPSVTSWSLVLRTGLGQGLL